MTAGDHKHIWKIEVGNINMELPVKVEIEEPELSDEQREKVKELFIKFFEKFDKDYINEELKKYIEKEIKHALEKGYEINEVSFSLHISVRLTKFGIKYNVYLEVRTKHWEKSYKIEESYPYYTSYDYTKELNEIGYQIKQILTQNQH